MKHRFHISFIYRAENHPEGEKKEKRGDGKNKYHPAVYRRFELQVSSV
jgi:hypothetical protein